MTGAAIGPYHILEKIGAGGMGEVLLGHDPRLDRRVALKCLTSVEATTPEGHARILREGRAAARLTHANIAGIYDVLEEGDRTYIVMEYVEGVSLTAHLAEGARPPREVCAVGRQLASALAAAHAQGVVHRDLKPANIHVTPDGSIKVLDFGVARLTSPVGRTTDTTRGSPAHEATVEGNPGTTTCMAPEQLRGQPADARSDIYSAGVILFQMATGRRPFLEINAVSLALAMNAGPAPAARSINPLVPPELSAAIAQALEGDPDKRFQSAHELEAALAAIPATSTATWAVDAPSRTMHARRVWIAAAATVALLGVIGSWTIVSLRNRSAARSTAAPMSTRQAIAVLPLENLSGDASKAYLGVGVAETLTMALSKLPDFTVLSRSEVQEMLRRQTDVRT